MTRSKKEMAELKKKKWTDDEAHFLIELLEERICLWDICSNNYTLME